jgi:hypothetical protein
MLKQSQPQMMTADQARADGRAQRVRAPAPGSEDDRRVTLVRRPHPSGLRAASAALAGTRKPCESLTRFALREQLTLNLIG